MVLPLSGRQAHLHGLLRAIHEISGLGLIFQDHGITLMRDEGT